MSEMATTTFPSTSLKLPALLIVDDEVNVTRSLARSLRDQFTVYTANSAVEALEIIEQHEISVVLTDQRMPDMTGVELLEEIRKRNPRINGILLSGYSDATALMQALNLGSVRGFIPKPWDINTLKTKLLETVEVFEHLMTESTATGQSAGINQQKLSELKSFFEFINTLDAETPASSELRQLVKNPYPDSMPDNEYLNQLLDGFALVQSESRFTFCNPAFRRLLTLVKNCQKEILTIDDLKEYPDIYEALQQGITGQHSHFDTKLTSTAGKPIYVEITVTPFLDKAGRYHAVLVMHDQTEKEKTISYLRGMNRVAFALNNYREFIDGLELALRACVNTFNVDAVAFYFLDADEHSFTYECSIGLEPGAIEFLIRGKGTLRIPKEKLAAENDNSITVWDVTQGAMPIFPELTRHQPIQSAAFAAIYEQDKIIGVLALYHQSPRSFEDDRLLLSAISNQIGTARVNAQLQAELQQQARMDILTGLNNRRYFFMTAERYYTRGKFNHSPLAVFMIDADRFKQINDVYGHLVGDQALKAIALLLNNSIRPGDLICRYGGDEFAFIIPDCDLDLAEKITDRIKSQFAAYQLPVGESYIPLSVSTGFAIASFDNNETLEGLLNLSDAQMYLNKHKKTHPNHDS